MTCLLAARLDYLALGPLYLGGPLSVALSVERDGVVLRAERQSRDDEPPVREVFVGLSLGRRGGWYSVLWQVGPGRRPWRSARSHGSGWSPRGLARCVNALWRAARGRP